MTTPPSQQPPQPPAPTPPAPEIKRPPVGEAKTLGMVGAILNLVGFIAGVTTGFGFIVLLIGIILIYMATSKLSELVRDDRVRSYYLKFLIIDIAAIVTLIAGALVIFGGALLGVRAFGRRGLEALTGILAGALIGVLVVLIVFWLLEIFAVLNLRRSYDLIKRYTGVNMFGVTGLLYLLGAVLIVILVGFLLLLIAIVLEIVSWASLPESIEARREAAPSPITLV